MKRIIAFLLILSLLLAAFAGCSKKQTASGSWKDNVVFEEASGDSTFVGNTQSGGNNGSAASSNGSTASVSSQNGSSSHGLGDTNITVDSSVINSQTSSGGAIFEGDVQDVSGAGVTQNGVETVLSANALTNEHVLPKFEKLTYEHTNGKKMCYNLRLPTDYDKSKKYPVLMFLHGINDTGSNWNTTGHLGPLYAYNGDIVNKMIFISPQALDSSDLWGANSGGNGDIAFNLLKKVVSEYNADTNRIYIMGLSMGGIGTWSIIEKHADYFAAASPICGIGNTMDAEKLVNLPIWGWHGTADKRVDYNWPGATPFMYDAINQAGGKLMIFSKLEGVEHDAWTPAFSSREHLSWMYAQIKGKHQSKDYSLIPYLTVSDSKGNVIISEKDALFVEFRKGTGKLPGRRDLCLNLTENATKKLSEAYQKSGGKHFTVKLGNNVIMTYKATKKTTGRVFVIRDVFTDSNYNLYYNKLMTTAGRN